MNILILGVGNVLLSDEGIGVRVVDELVRRYHLPESVTALDGGTAGMELLAEMAGKDRVVIVDAVRTGRAPGTRVRLAGDEVPAFFRTRISPHQVGISDVLATLHITGEQPGEVVVVGVEPVSLDTGLKLTAPVAAQLEPMLAMVLDELGAVGCGPEPREVPLAADPRLAVA